MQRQRATLDLDQEVASLLTAWPRALHVSEEETVERAVLRALLARIRARSDLDEDDAMALVQKRSFARRESNTPRDPRRRRSCRRRWPALAEPAASTVASAVKPPSR
jgi:hypothetical protein